MDKKAFKQRMQDLKSYRGNNPGKGYWDWRNSLPDNLKYTDDTEYNMLGAYEAGLLPEYVYEDDSYHLPSRNPNTGEILKKSIHPTYWKGLEEDARLGYDAYHLGDRTWTSKKGDAPIQAFADGGETGDPEKWNKKNPQTTSERPLRAYTDSRGNTQVSPMTNTGAGYLSNYDPVTASFVEGAVLSPVFNLVGKGVGKAINLLRKGKVGTGRAYSTDGDGFLANRMKQWEQQVAEQLRVSTNRKVTNLLFSNLLDGVYESLIENEDAFRRAALIDQKYGTNYVLTYSKLLKDYASKADDAVSMAYDSNMLPGDRAYVAHSKPNLIRINEAYPYYGEALPDGLIAHEVGHTVDLNAGNSFLKKLGDRKKFLTDLEIDLRYTKPETRSRIKNYLLQGTEIKSHMNEFRNYLMNTQQWQEKETLKTFRKKLFNTKDKEFDNLKKIFDVYNNPKLFIKDYNYIPIVSTGAPAINSYFNNGKDYEMG